MQCSQCGYSLWNVPGRTCPECGKSFLPSEFRFEPNAVEFCCPGCMQQYYGTSAAGLLEPTEFECVRCRMWCNLDAMVLRPAPGAVEGRIEQPSIPWTQLQSGGAFKRFWRTVGLVMTSPSQIGRSLRTADPARSAWRFAAAVGLCATLPTALTFVGIAIISAIVDASSTRSGGSIVAPRAMVNTGWGLGWSLLLMLAGVIALAVMAAIAQGLLLIMGERPAWKRVWAGYAYGCAPGILMMVPLLGFYCAFSISPVWAAIATFLILGAALDSPTSKVVIAVLGPPVIVGCGMIALVWVGITLAVGSASAAASAAAANAAANQSADDGTGTVDAADGDAAEPESDSPGMEPEEAGAPNTEAPNTVAPSPNADAPNADAPNAMRRPPTSACAYLAHTLKETAWNIPRSL